MSRQFHTSRQVAAALNISLSALRAAWARGEGPRQTWFGGALRVSDADLNEYIAACARPSRRRGHDAHDQMRAAA